MLTEGPLPLRDPTLAMYERLSAFPGASEVFKLLTHALARPRVRSPA